jgi:hypothetical protein
MRRRASIVIIIPRIVMWFSIIVIISTIPAPIDLIVIICY